MFSKAKHKTKSATLKLRAKVTSTKANTMANTQTVSLASIPIADLHGVVAQPSEKLPGLYATGKAPKPSTQTKAKKALRFEDTQDKPAQLTPTAPPLSEVENQEEEDIVEHDIATQTTNNSALPLKDSASGPQPQTSSMETTTTDYSESPEEDTAQTAEMSTVHG